MLRALALLLVLSAGAPLAAADSTQSVAIIAVEIRGDASPELRTQLHRSLVEGLEAKGAVVIDLEGMDAHFEREPELDGCVSTTCLERLEEMAGTGSFVRARVETAGADYQVTLELLAPEAEGALVRKLERRCTVCTITEVLAMVKEAGSQMFVAQPRGHVLIDTDPAGATLSIDGEELGPAPQSAELAPGSYEVVATLEGRLTARQQIEVTSEGTASAPQRHQLSLAPAVAADQSSREPRTFRYWKWAAAGGGAIAIITGAVLIGMDDSQSCDRESAEHQCPKVVETMAGGVTSVIAGVGLGALSGWMFWRDARGDREARAGVSPSAGGGAVGSVELRF